ncbi:MAG: adenosine kinase [Natronospirillum sp.]|uniref:adenosine kinase n=1 Tax=Natronospirillum sp. TaxID=2812955 RepID=UPI0025FA9124|nr:adenosine kinase [Natronospirillum sp.]MCH8552078.1 adenosine kinase [Natronospirillum sp.]
MITGPAVDCDIFALGHAVVDVEYEVSHGLLRDLGFTAGGRYLLDDGQFQILHAALQAPGAGATWIAQSGGGSAANSVVTAQRLGARCHFASKLAQDAAGWFYQQTLLNEGIMIPDAPLAEGISGHCLVLITPDAERTMLLHLGVTTQLDTGLLDLDALQRARSLYLESYLVTDPVARNTVNSALTTAHQAGVPVCISLSDAGIVTAWRDTLKHWFAPRVSTLIGNESEALAWGATDQLDKALDKLAPLAEQIVITRGAAGVIIVDRSGQTIIEAPKVSAVSSLGAGDTFAGALLHGLHYERWPLARSADFASRCAARKVEFNGPRLAREQLVWMYSQFTESGGPARQQG